MTLYHGHHSAGSLFSFTQERPIVQLVETIIIIGMTLILVYFIKNKKVKNPQMSAL